MQDIVSCKTNIYYSLYTLKKKKLYNFKILFVINKLYKLSILFSIIVNMRPYLFYEHCFKILSRD